MWHNIKCKCKVCVYQRTNASDCVLSAFVIPYLTNISRVKHTVHSTDRLSFMLTNSKHSPFTLTESEDSIFQAPAERWLTLDDGKWAELPRSVSYHLWIENIDVIVSRATFIRWSVHLRGERIWMHQRRPVLKYRAQTSERRRGLKSEGKILSVIQMEI